MLGGFYDFRRCFLYICICCSLCGVSGRCAGCPIMLHYMAASLPAFPGCIASINPAYSVRLSSGSVRGAACPGVVSICAACSRIAPGVLTVSGLEDPAGRRRSVRADSIPLPVSGFPALCPIMLPRFRRSCPGPVSGLPGLPGSRRSPSPTKKPKSQRYPFRKIKSHRKQSRSRNF